MIISPVLRFCHSTSLSQVCFSKLYLVVFYSFTIASYQYLLKSSIPSLNIDNVITKTKGAIEAAGLNGDIIAIDYIIAFIKKYILA